MKQRGDYENQNGVWDLLEQDSSRHSYCWAISLATRMHTKTCSRNTIKGILSLLYMSLRKHWP